MDALEEMAVVAKQGTDGNGRGGEAIVKEGLVKRRVNYFPVYQSLYAVLHANGRFEYFYEKTRESCGTIAIDASTGLSALEPSHVQALKNRKQKVEACALSLYHEGTMILRLLAPNADEAKEWHSAFAKVIKGRRGKDRGSEPMNLRKASLGQTPQDVITQLKHHSEKKWETVSMSHGIRILRQASNSNMLFSCLRAGVAVKGTSDEIMSMLRDQSEEWDETIERLTVLEDVNKHSKIVHVKINPSYVGPFPISARDAVLRMYWGTMQDGSSLLTFQSVVHKDVPEHPDYVRAKFFFKGFLITPLRDSELEDLTHPSQQQHYVTLIVQADPKGWLGKLPKAIAERWIYPFMQKLLYLKDTMEERRFMQIDYKAISNYASAEEMDRKASSLKSDLAPNKGSMEETQWNDVSLEETPFRVRGANYLTDKVKVLCKQSKFKLVALDLWETPGKMESLGDRSHNLRHSLKQPFVFMVHFQVPGPPYLSLVAYFVPRDETVMTLGTPFGDLLNSFLNKDDDFRDGTFKLIPRVVEGSWVVKKGVGATPAILGRKLKQTYHGDGQSYFELCVDVGSSSIAGSILGLVKGYATSLVIDLAFLLEGNQPDHLPEEIFGCIRLQRPDISSAKLLNA